MKIAVIVCRILLGALFVFSGLNSLFGFIKAPPMTGDVGEWSRIMLTSHYFGVVGFCELVGGGLLMVGRYVPLGLVFLGPVIVNIVTFHLTIGKNANAVTAVVVLIQLFLMWAYRSSFAPLFVAKAPIS